MLAVMEWIIRCFAVLAAVSCFLFCSCSCFSFAKTTPTANNSAGDRSNIDIDSSDEHGASFLISASLRQQSKHQAPTGYPSASARSLFVPGPPAAAAAALRERARIAKTTATASPHNNRQLASQRTHTSPTYEQRQATPPPVANSATSTRAHT